MQGYFPHWWTYLHGLSPGMRQDKNKVEKYQFYNQITQV